MLSLIKPSPTLLKNLEYAKKKISISPIIMKTFTKFIRIVTDDN